MQDLTVDRIIAVHAEVIARDGGDSRIISEANLHELVFRVNLLTDPIPRAALTLFSLVAYPAFREGNERIAQELAARILEEGRYVISIENSGELSRLAEGITAFTVEPEDIEAWFAAHAKKKG
ncbi:MAG: hypothetical protein M0Q92_03880 [Methanoregula sp.]|jgi:prophage maintenance system killer protein|nr:hypothetical protein [Methanoregula sp.]